MARASRFEELRPLLCGAVPAPIADGEGAPDADSPGGGAVVCTVPEPLVDVVGDALVVAAGSSVDAGGGAVFAPVACEAPEVPEVWLGDVGGEALPDSPGEPAAPAPDEVGQGDEASGEPEPPAAVPDDAPPAGELAPAEEDDGGAFDEHSPDPLEADSDSAGVGVAGAGALGPLSPEAGVGLDSGAAALDRSSTDTAVGPGAVVAPVGAAGEVDASGGGEAVESCDVDAPAAEIKSLSGESDAAAEAAGQATELPPLVDEHDGVVARAADATASRSADSVKATLHAL